MSMVQHPGQLPENLLDIQDAIIHAAEAGLTPEAILALVAATFDQLGFSAEWPSFTMAAAWTHGHRKDPLLARAAKGNA